MLAKAVIVRCPPKVVPKVIHKLFKNRKACFKIQAKALKNKCKESYTLLSWQNNFDNLE